ncbi:MAG: sugar phosphate isomerase/epimerase family protein, partial [Planctomycetota bacterium]
MRFGLNALLYTASFSTDDLDLIPKIAEIGYDGIELPFIDLDAIDAQATRKALEAADLGATGCAVLVPGTNLLSDEADERAAAVARLKRCVDLAAEMGAEAVAGPLYAPVSHLTGRERTAAEWD